MTDEVSKRGKTLPIGNDQWDIRDDGVRVEFVDLITEGRVVQGVVYLSFASGVMDGDNKPAAHISVRMRMHLGSAQSLHQLLGNMIRDALKPADISKAN